MASQACCDAGPAITSDYEPKGTISKVKDFDVYKVGSGPATVVIVYDIFGLSKQAKQVADKIADAGFTVVLPDFVRGDYMDNDMSKFGAWAGKHSFDDEIKPTMGTVIAHLKEGGSTSFGVLGFCWGGWMSMTSGTTDMYKCCAMVHAANLSSELAEKVKVPQCILPSGEDPSIDEVKAVLDKKDFGSDCVYKVFEDMHHGFCAARGDWTNELQAKRASEAVGIVSDFFKKHLK